MRDGTTPFMDDAERLAHLEDLRDRVKAYNASCKAGNPRRNRLPDYFLGELDLQARINWLNENGSFRPYVLQNLGATIRRLRLKVSLDTLVDEAEAKRILEQEEQAKGAVID